MATIQQTLWSLNYAGKLEKLTIACPMNSQFFFGIVHPVFIKHDGFISAVQGIPDFFLAFSLTGYALFVKFD